MAVNIEEQGIIELQFKTVQAKLKQRFDKVPDLDAILFLIGIQEVGNLNKKFSKNQKQDLMHVAVCKLLSQDGLYQLTAYDDEGWPHFEPQRKLPRLSTDEQELLLKKNVIQYFDGL